MQLYLAVKEEFNKLKDIVFIFLMKTDVSKMECSFMSTPFLHIKDK